MKIKTDAIISKYVSGAERFSHFIDYGVAVDNVMEYKGVLTEVTPANTVTVALLHCVCPTNCAVDDGQSNAFHFIIIRRTVSLSAIFCALFDSIELRSRHARKKAYHAMEKAISRLLSLVLKFHHEIVSSVAVQSTTGLDQSVGSQNRFGLTPEARHEAYQSMISAVPETAENNLSGPPGEIHNPCPIKGQMFGSFILLITHYTERILLKDDDSEKMLPDDHVPGSDL
ncbi:hypothetical protein J6590_007054 [Homalodisca vitripennis]|nr:hypothetical protein J6590_007054 [Homalodisca vitripennis]